MGEEGGLTGTDVLLAEPPAPAAPTEAAPVPAGRSPRWALLRLVLVVATVIALGVLVGAGPWIFVILVVIAMILVHELGHFATAKWSGMKVTEYFLGFGPRLWSVRKGETEYGVKAIPAGGYVKIPGMSSLEEIDPVDEPRTYRQQPYYQRVIVASAGSFMHLVMAFLLALGGVLAFGTPSSHGVEIAGFVSWAGHSQNAAQAAGLKVGDVIVAVDGRTVTDPDQVDKAIESHPGRPLTVTVSRDGKDRAMVVTPARGYKDAQGGESLRGHGKAQGLLGIAQASPFAPVSAGRAVPAAAGQVWRVTTASLGGIAHVFSPSGIGSLLDQVANSNRANQAADNPGAPQNQRVESIYGAVHTAVQAQQAGMAYLIAVLVALNIGIAIINMLPILPFDGGHVAIAVYERIRTKKGQPYYRADVRKQLPVVYVVLGLLAIVVVSALFLDIAHPQKLPFP
jgi:membrane-associated protease RseP (regulator of RpoE activity)